MFNIFNLWKTTCTYSTPKMSNHTFAKVSYSTPLPVNRQFMLNTFHKHLMKWSHSVKYRGSYNGDAITRISVINSISRSEQWKELSDLDIIALSSRREGNSSRTILNFKKQSSQWKIIKVSSLSRRLQTWKRIGIAPRHLYYLSRQLSTRLLEKKLDKFMVSITI